MSWVTEKVLIAFNESLSTLSINPLNKLSIFFVFFVTICYKLLVI